MALLLGLAVIIVLALMPMASSDLANAATPGYDSKIGYDKPQGWLAMAVLIGCLVLVAGMAGCGPLAMLAQ